MLRTLCPDHSSPCKVATITLVVLSTRARRHRRLSHIWKVIRGVEAKPGFLCRFPGTKKPEARLGSRSDLIYLVARHYIVWIGVRRPPSGLLCGLILRRSICFTFIRRLFCRRLLRFQYFSFQGKSPKVFFTIGNCERPNGLFMKLISRHSCWNNRTT